MNDNGKGRAALDGKPAPRYAGTREQVGKLKTALLAAQQAGTSLSAMLAIAGLDDPEAKVRYDEPNLWKFLKGKTTAPRLPVAAALYDAFVPDVAPPVDRSEVCQQFGHLAKIVLDVTPYAQDALTKLLEGHYHFYLRSALVPGHFVKGLLSVASERDYLLMREVQYHDGSGGLPELHETWKGYVMKKGDLIFMVTQNFRLKGVSFTIVDRTVKLSPGRPDGQHAGVVYGTRLQGQESQGRPMTSPFAATRVRAEWASPDTYKKGPPDARLGLVAQPPPLLRSYFSDGQIPHPVSDAAD